MATIGTLRNGRYNLTRCDEDDAEGRTQYLIEGKRGAVYGLLRNKNPRLLFAVNVFRPTASTPFDGVWFEETSTELASTDGDVVALG